MQIRVVGRNLEVPPSLHEATAAKMSKIRAIFDHFIEMDVVLSEDSTRIPGERYRCEAVLHAKGRYLRATGTGSDPSGAIDQAEEKLRRQVRKLKTQIVRRRRSSPAIIR